MIKYRIEGQYLDQFQDEEFAVTKAISKIGEIDLRHGDFSTSFKVPLTARNIAILRYTPELNNLSTLDNFRRYNGALVEDDVVVSDGYYQVTGFNATKKEATLNFFGGNSDWFDLLKDRYINEVVKVEDSQYPYNLDNCKHTSNVTNIAASWDLTNDLPYYYFFNDNGKNSIKSTTNQTDVNDWRLSIFEKKIFERIFESVDIKLKGTLFNDPLFVRTVVSSVVDITTGKRTQEGYSYTLPSLSQTIRGNNSAGIVNFTTGAYDSRWSGNTFTSNEDNTTFKINQYGIRISFGGSTSDNPSTTCDLVYTKTGQSAVVYPLQQLAAPNVEFGSFVFENDTEISLTLNAGESASFFFRQSLSTDRTIVASSSGDERTFFNYESETVSGVYISDVTRFLPKIKQTDFVKDVMFRFGAVSQYDVATRTLTLDKFENIDTNRIYAPDWSNKIDLSKDVVTNYTKIIGNYSKRSIIDLQDDENDIYNELIRSVYSFNLGRGVINIDNDFIDNEKTIYTSPYASTLTIRTISTQRNNPNLDPNSGEYWLPYIPTNKTDGQDDVGNAAFANNEIKPRILLATGLIKVDAFAINDSLLNLGGTNYSEVGYAYFMKPNLKDLGGGSPQEGVILDNIDETLAYQLQTDTVNQYNGITLFDRYFNLYRKILNDPFYVSLYMNLSALDVQQVDFLTPIFLDYQYDSGYYYIDSIEQYKGDGTTTKVNLVKI